MNYTFAAKTDTGRTRSNNEDSVVFDEECALAVLADGMGGYNAGEVASSMATSLIESELVEWYYKAPADAKVTDAKRAMEVAADIANLAIFNSANTNQSYSGMGTTLVMSMVFKERLLVGHIGDSRAYRWRDGVLTQITKDHSLLQEQIDAGLVTPEQAANSSIRNLVTRAMGVEDTVLMEVGEFDVAIGDIYLLCSDGLSDMVSDESIAKIFVLGGSLEDISNALVDVANTNGGRDNISVLLMDVIEAPEKKGLIARLLGK